MKPEKIFKKLEDKIQTIYEEVFSLRDITDEFEDEAIDDIISDIIELMEEVLDDVETNKLTTIKDLISELG